MRNLNLREYHDRVLGCWTGKNIGGTLGAPFEWTREMPAVDFYTEVPRGEPIPNDDLDLQLIWLYAAEEQGVYALTPKRMAEYWLNYMAAPMGEYRNCMDNLVNGLYPPLSGSCNNEQWKNSNGAWIRSEIWACLFPGSPDEAARSAYIDACVDHSGDGIYAELFTASLESAAFIVHEIPQLLEIALARIPKESRIASSVRRAQELHAGGIAFDEARNNLVEHNRETGFGQSPLNLGFLVLALLYGNGDFERTLQLAVHCGDDTDCTAATAGALLGIIHGHAALPEKWKSPIGNKILTKCVNPQAILLPKTLEELTMRVIRLARRTLHENPTLISLTDAPTALDGIDLPELCASNAEIIWKRSPFEVSCELPFGIVGIILENGPEIQEGKPKKLRILLRSLSKTMAVLRMELLLPETWKCHPGSKVSIPGTRIGPQCGEITLELTPGDIADDIVFLPVKFLLSDRRMPEIRYLPFLHSGCVASEIRIRNGDAEARFLRRGGLPVRFPVAELSF